RRRGRRPLVLWTSLVLFEAAGAVGPLCFGASCALGLLCRGCSVLLWIGSSGRDLAARAVAAFVTDRVRSVTLCTGRAAAQEHGGEARHGSAGRTARIRGATAAGGGSARHLARQSCRGSDGLGSCRAAGGAAAPVGCPDDPREL